VQSVVNAKARAKAKPKAKQNAKKKTNIPMQPLDRQWAQEVKEGLVCDGSLAILNNMHM